MVMPKYGAAVDVNQKVIIDALKAIGCDVQVISRPVDLLVGYRNHNFLIECKAPDTYYKGTEVQRDFIRDWRGQVRVVQSADEAIRLVTKAYE